ncbi:MAG: FRG domain-containing protein [Syntrophaceae bacterium]|jgi:hypothetical protein|nr:FRG domain-containing protein [Syntrophaceae bacterium]
MYQLTGNIWTYVGGEREAVKIKVAEVRCGSLKIHHVKTFSELASKVAKLSFLNRQWMLLYRGQAQDFKTQRNLNSLYPSLYRPPSGKSFNKKLKKERFDRLLSKVKILREGYLQRFPKYRKEIHRLYIYEELCWALLQHYEVVLTPYLDVSSSLRVAASFALKNSSSGYLYVLGMPYPVGSISHFVDSDIKMVRLQAACPPSAKRPHFQEGYLIGSCSVGPEEQNSKENASRRLVAKFFIEDQKSFWTKDFQPIPDEALMPPADINLDWLKDK